MQKQERIIYPSAAYAATPAAVIFNTRDAAAVYFVVEVTDSADTPSVVFNFELWDATSATAVLLLASAAVTGASSNIYKVSPALTAAANLIAVEHVPLHVRVRPVHADTDSITYSISAHLI